MLNYFKFFVYTSTLFFCSFSFGQTFTVDFDDDTKWFISAAGYQTNNEYNDQNWLFTGGPALRQGTAAQDGFPGALGTYSWRLRDAAGVSWTATFNGTADISAFGFDVRRWDNSPDPDYTVEYSVNAGGVWNAVATINNAFLGGSSDWFTFSQPIASASVTPGDFIVRVSRNNGERIMIDNFSWTESVSSNTISTDAISSLTFNVDCDTDDTGTVTFTSVGTFNVGNVFTVQLSDELGSFASPLAIGSLSGVGAEGVDPSGIINVTIPAGTTQGTSYRVRVVSSDPTAIGTDNGADITINSALCPSQLPASEGLIINEFSNGATGEQEYYEFVVAGRCGETVDVRGYIIDDNNGTFTTDYSDPAGTGIASGHLRLTNHAQWSSIPVGSLIVVYNDGDPNSTLPADDPFDADNDSLYVIPHTFSVLVEINTTIPNVTAPADSNYTPATYGSTSWTALNIRNAGDAIQVRMPDGTYFHGVSYGGSEISGGPNNMKILNSGMSGMSGWFNSGDIFDANNWSTGNVAGNETPGLPNNAANLAWLRLMRDPLAAVCPVTPLPITLENFSGYYNGNSTILSWETLSEQNNDYFALYHSTNGKTFERIGTVSGSGNTTTLLNYSYEHRTPHPGINYYKLKSVDYDGTMHDKGIIAVLVEMNHIFYDQITQSIQMNYESDYAVYGSDGRLVKRVFNQNAIPFSGHGVFHVIDERSGKAFKLGIW